MRSLTLPLIATMGLAACGSQEQLPAFNSPQERACYLQARDTLGPNQQLLRAGDNFALVTRDQGFVRSTGRSEVFDSCMEAGTSGAIAAGEQPLQLTPQELAIWDTLTDAQKKQAYQFILEGGKLADFVANL